MVPGTQKANSEHYVYTGKLATTDKDGIASVINSFEEKVDEVVTITFGWQASDKLLELVGLKSTVLDEVA